jgi:hypothetical protein
MTLRWYEGISLECLHTVVMDCFVVPIQPGFHAMTVHFIICTATPFRNYLTCNIIASPIKEGVAIPINHLQFLLNHYTVVPLRLYTIPPLSLSPPHIKKIPGRQSAISRGKGLWSERPCVHEERDKKHKTQRGVPEKSDGPE